MNILFYIVGGIVIAYWLFGMSQPVWNRPLMINKNGGLVLVSGVAAIIIGFII